MLILFPLAFIRERCQIYTSLEVVKVKSMCIALITSKEKETDQCTRGLGRSSVEGANELGHPCWGLGPATREPHHSSFCLPGRAGHHDSSINLHIH